MADSSYYAKKKAESDKKIQDALNARKARNTNAESSNAKSSDSKISAALEARGQRVQNSLPDVLADIQKALTVEIDSYRSAKPTYGAYEDTYNSQRERRINISSLRDRVKAYRNYMDSSAADEIISALDQMESGYDAYLSLSEFDSEDDYNSWYASQKDKEQKLSSDTLALQKELDELTVVQEEYNSRVETLKKYYLTNDYTFVTKEEVDEAIAYTKEAEEKYGITVDKTIDNIVQDKKLYLSDAKRLQEGAKLASVSGNADFEDFNGYASTETDGVWAKLTSQYGMGYDDLTYEYINGAENGKRREILNKTISYSADTNLENADKWTVYDHMTEDEIGIYNYHYAKDGKEAAQKYLDSIQESLNARKAGEMYANMEDKTLLELAFGVAAGLDQFKSGAKGAWNAITGNEEYIPASATQMASGMVREDLADKTLPVWYNFKEGQWEDQVFGRSVGQAAYDTVTTTANMLPSIMTAKALSMLNPVAGGAWFSQVVGTGMMGASAAGNAYQEVINLGYDKDQARAYAALVGGSEAGLQYLLGGIGDLGGKLSGNVLTKMMNGVDNAFARTALKLGGNMFSEGLEEGLQEVLTPWFQNLVLHTDNDVDWNEVAYSSLLGALTAGVMEGGGTIYGEVNTYKTGKNLQAADISAERLSEIGKTFSADTVAYQLAGRVNENTGAYTMGRLFNEIGASLSEQNITEITNALVAKGMDEATARKNAKALAYVVEGGQLSDRQIAVIEGNEILAEVARTTLIDANTTWNQRSKGYNDMLKALADEMTSSKTSRTGQAQQGVENAPTSDTVDGQTKNGTESHSEAESVDTSPAKVQSFSAINKGQATIKLEDGSEVSVKDADLAPDDGVRIETIASIEGISATDATFVLNTLRSNTGASAQMDALGAKEAYKYGFYGFSMEHMTKHGVFANSLTESQRQAIYETGKQARQKQIENTSPKKGTGTGKQTEIYFDSGNGNVVAFRDAKKTLTEKQTAGVQAAMVLRKLGIGGDIYFFESYRNANGQLVYKNSKGVEVKAPNGWYSEADGSIHIDLKAGKMGDGLVLFTLAHELTHFIEQWSPQKYKVLADFLVENYEKGQSMDGLVRAKQAKLSAQRGKNVSYKEAYSEVVADSMESMLADGNVLEKLVELKAKDNALFTKMKQFFDNLLNKIRSIYKGQVPDSIEGRAVLEMTDSIEKIQQLFADALVDASENFRAAEKNTTDEGGVKFEIREIGNTGRFYVQADRQVITGDNASLWGKQVEKYINEKIRKDQDVALPTSDGHVLLLTGRSAYKLSDNHVASITKKIDAFMSDEDYALKGRAAAHIDELIQVARFNGYEADLNNKHENDIGEDGFNYFESYFRDFDGKYYRVPLSSALNEQEETAYSIGRIRQRSFPAGRGSSSQKEALKNGRKASGDIIYTSEAKSQEVKTALQLAYEKALKKKDVDEEATETYQATEQVGMEVDTATESVAPRVMNSERTWTESDYVQEREQAAKEIAKAIGVSVKKAKAYIDSVNSIAKMIAEDRVRLDYFSSLGRSSFVGNVEYGGSFDFSTLCKKRRLLTGTFTAIQKALPNTALTADEILDIRNRMKDAGLEVSCGLCYVEGSRANMGQFAKEFLRLYKQYYPDAWQPNMADVNTPDGIEWVRINHPECYEQYEYFWNHYGTLKDGDKNLFASQQKPKLYQLHTECKGEILEKFNDDDNVEEKNLNGGIRLQSFSDFEIVHLIDTMQIIMDMSRVGLAGQAYTKVPDFAWALGDTGLKINLSLIAKGVDENGKLIFDDVEGMPIDKAVELRNRYSKNVGTILVAFNDEQLLAAMADERVDYIIPFHRSQWKKSQYGAMGLPAKTKDYTYMQNEKFIKPQYHEYRGRMVKDKATNYMPNEYWDFSKSGKENAEVYLEMCARNNKRPKFYKLLQNNGDGSYSLKADGSTDGYWKLLIDFKMYDNNGVGSPQMPVKPDFNMDEATRMLDEYSGGHSNFPVAQGVVDSFVEEYKDSHKGVQFSDRDSDGNQLSEDQVEYFENSQARNRNGNLQVVYHGGTVEYEFDTSRGGKGDTQYGPGSYFTDSEYYAKEYTWYRGGNVRAYYLNIEKMFDDTNMDITVQSPEWQKLEQILRSNGVEDKFINQFKSAGFAYMSRYLAVKAGAKTSGSWEGSEKLNAMIREAGFQGIKGDLNDSYQYVIFTPNQAKLTTNEVPSTFYDTRYSDRDTAALEAFGTTTNFEQAGFVLGDGRMLNLSQYGLNGVKHQRIEQVYDDVKGSEAINRFIQEGHVRIKASSPGIEIGSEAAPTVSQMNTISRFINTSLVKKGYFYLDITGKNGETIASVEYDEDASTEDIIWDIKDYYDRGKVPKERRTLFQDRDYVAYDRTAILNEETVDRWLKDYASKAQPNYAQMYITYMSPDKFLKLTTSITGRYYIEKESKSLDEAEFADYTKDQPIFLEINHETGEVTGHEGRHRCVALLDAGISSVPVLLQDYSNKLDKQAIDSLKLTGQVFKDSRSLDSFNVKDIIPLNYANRDEIIKRFATKSSMQRVGESLGLRQTLKFQDRDTDSVSNRSLLANAFEGVAQNEIEKNKIREYKGKIDLINAEEQKLSELNEKIKELSFAKGPRDTKAIRDLQFEARQTANRISTYDKQLLRLEASKPLQDVLQREKKMAYKRAEQKGKEALEAYREKTMKTQRELLEKWQESRKKGIDSRNRTAMRHKIKDVVNELNQYLLRGTKERHVPIELQKAVAEALDAVNMDTVGAEERIAKLKDELLKAKTPEQIQEISRKIDHIQAMGDKMNGRLQKLKEAYDQFVNSDDPLIANSHDEVISNKLQSVIDSIGNTPLRDMTFNQLEDVYDMYRMVLTTIRNANKAFKAKKNESISTIANQVMVEVEKVGGKQKQSLAMLNGIKSFGWNNLKPVYAFEHIGSEHFTEVFNNVRAGEDVWAVDVTEAREFYLDKSKKHNYDSWDLKKRYNFTSTSGMDFELDLEQIMSLYAYSKREQAADHLKKGGIVFDESTKIIKKTKAGISLEFNPTEATAYNISEETLADIVSKLTGEQKAFVDEMQDYLSTVMGAKGNEVSLEMYGVKLFKEKFYFPLKSAQQFMAKAKEQQQGEAKIKNSGFSKETVQKASNPIVLTPFMNVWADHVNEMSMYHAFVLPMEDFYRVYNYKTPTSDTMATESVEMFIQNAYGKGATKYIDQLLKDLNGGARSDTTTGVINKMIGLFKKGAVFASLSVVIQQPSAIARAAALVDTKYFIGPKVNHKRHKALWDEVKQYAPVAIIKEMGYFDTHMGKSTQDFIIGKEYSGFKDKMSALVKDSDYRDEVLSKAPALADEIAWCGIWEAVKRELKAKNPGMDVKSEAFLKMAGERFTEVIVKTQVYDSVLSRSGMMRSKDTGMKMATSFMAEPTTSINMVADALLQGKRGNRKYARAAIGAVIASQILNSILVSFVYAGRDDDEEETYWEKYIGTLSAEFLDSLNPLTYIPFIKDIVSIVQGYDVERSDMAIISDLWKAWENLGNDNVSTYRKVEGFAGSIAQIFGLPVKNIMRDARGIYQTVMSFVDGEHTTAAGIGHAIKGSITGKDVSNGQQLYEAYLSGDEDHIARLVGRYEDESAVNSAMRSAIKDHYDEGDISSETAISYLVEYAGMEEDDAYWKLQEWEYESVSDDEFGKYNKFYEAVQTGKNLKAVIKEYTDNGVEMKSLKSRLTSHFKPMYIDMSNAEKSSIKGYLLNAYELCGYDRTDAADLLAEWEYESNHPDLVGRISYSQYKRWQTDGKPRGASIELFTDVAEFRDGGTSGSTKSQEEVAAYINSLSISSTQKDALWCCFWKESTLKNAPWH